MADSERDELVERVSESIRLLAHAGMVPTGNPLSTNAVDAILPGGFDAAVERMAPFFEGEPSVTWPDDAEYVARALRAALDLGSTDERK